MHFCYVDESGDTGTLASPTHPIQPVLVILGVALDHTHLAALTHEFIDLKARFSPALASRLSGRFDILLHEAKGTALRKEALSSSRRESRRALGFLDHVVTLLEKHEAKVFGRVWIKALRYPMDGNAVFTSSMQAICGCFERYLTQRGDCGLVIADSRSPGQNVPVAFSIFTQKFQAAGDAFGRILEMPTFGHSDNHVGLQLADLVVSGLIFPMAVVAYCTGRVENLHVRPGYQVLRQRFGPRLKRLQFRYQKPDGRWAGGITVSDALGRRSGSLLFGDPPTSPPAEAPTPDAQP